MKSTRGSTCKWTKGRSSGFFFLFLICSYSASFGQGTSTLSVQTWADSTRAIVLDIYAGNTIEWEKVCTDKRVAAVIHKASEGLVADVEYLKRKPTALKKGFLWGSYHLGKSGDPIAQADFYLSIVGNDSNQLLALDLEDLDSTKWMSLSNAERFIDRVYERTGRYPFLYCNHKVLSAISAQYSRESILAQCPLWYARFRGDIPDFNTTLWNVWTMWQFSSELNCKKNGDCLYNVPGADRFVDINVYNGTVEELRVRWSRW